MLTFQYTARDPSTGKKVTANVQADNEAAASKLIQKEGLAPIEVKVLTEGGNNFFSRFLNRVGTKDKIIFSRQMSTLINAGLPLVQSLRNVESQTQNKSFKVIINDIISSVESGKAFSEALSKHPKVFNAIYLSLIGSGEVSGTLDKALERIAQMGKGNYQYISKENVELQLIREAKAKKKK